MIVEMLLLQLEDTAAVHQLYLSEIFFSPPMVCKNAFVILGSKFRSIRAETRTLH